MPLHEDRLAAETRHNPTHAEEETLVVGASSFIAIVRVST